MIDCLRMQKASKFKSENWYYSSFSLFRTLYDALKCTFMLAASIWLRECVVLLLLIHFRCQLIARMSAPSILTLYIDVRRNKWTRCKKNERSHFSRSHSVCIRDIEKFQRCEANATSAMWIGYLHEWKFFRRFQFSFQNNVAQFYSAVILLSCVMCAPPESYVTHLWIWMSDKNLSRTYLNNDNDQMHKILKL